MFDELTETEQQIAIMLMQGQSCTVIMEWVGIDYKEYTKYKCDILRKLKIKRIAEILVVALTEHFIDDEL